MLQVSIPVHPLSRAALLSHYGAEPICIDNNHDILFQHLAGHCVRHSSRNYPHLTSTIRFAVNDTLAIHVNQFAVEVGARLYNWHKLQLCLYALAHYKAKGSGSIRAAIAEWLTIYEVDEEDYSVETGYKLFQRYYWELQKKNPRFAGQIRRKPEQLASEEKARRARFVRIIQEGRMYAEDVEPELAAARFLASAAEVFRRLPSRLPKQVRTYMYVTQHKLSVRDAARKLGISPSTVHDHVRSICRRAQENPTFRILLAQSCALPQPA